MGRMDREPNRDYYNKALHAAAVTDQKKKDIQEER